MNICYWGPADMTRGILKVISPVIYNLANVKFGIHLASYGVCFLWFISNIRSVTLNFGISFATLLGFLFLAFFKVLSVSMCDSLITSRENNEDVSPNYLNLGYKKFDSGNIHISIKHKKETWFLALTVENAVISSSFIVKYLISLNFTLIGKVSNAIFQEFMWCLNSSIGLRSVWAEMNMFDTKYATAANNKFLIHSCWLIKFFYFLQICSIFL